MGIFNTGVRLAVGTTAVTAGWNVVRTPHDYEPGDMVVLATPIYTGETSLIVRVRNADRNTFEIRAENVDGGAVPAGVSASWLTVRAGRYNLDNGAARFEAARRPIAAIDGALGTWTGEPYEYLQSYEQPIVLGQVMSANSSWSTFWARGRRQSTPPTSTDCFVGRHVGEDPNPARSAEELGIVVFESGPFELNGIRLRPELIAASGRGFTPTQLNFDGFDLTSALCSPAGMFSNEGAWPTIFGDGTSLPLTDTAVRLEEDRLGDDERTHITESVAVLLIDAVDDASRLLGQGGFGAALPELRRVAAMGHDRWITEQVAAPRSLTAPYMDELIAIEQPEGNALENGSLEERTAIQATYPFLFTFADQGVPDTLNFTTIWLRNLLHGSDQLRQRVAFTLSQILVTSGRGSQLRDTGGSMADYFDMLSAHAFGNFRDLLRDVSVHPAMSYFLSSLGNKKPDIRTNQQPDENYAREVMQLFSIGLWDLHRDGTQKLDADGNPIPTYSNEDITNVARIFTGLWYVGRPFGVEGNIRKNQGVNRLPLVVFPEHHDTDAKLVFAGQPWELRLSGNDDGLTEINTFLDVLFNHPNTAPFICRRLIQFLVTSNPRPGYVRRVADVFDDNGGGVRGDMGAVIRAILLDREARLHFPDNPTHGKVLEPMVRLGRVARCFSAGTAPHDQQAPEPGLDEMQFWRFRGEVDSFAQWPLYSPSVFNFFEPDYSHGGPLRDAGLLSPELQIHTPVTAVTFPNELATIIDRGFQPHRRDITEPFTLDLNAEVPYAFGDGSELIDRLDTLLCSGKMTAETRNLILAQLEIYPADTPAQATNALSRVRLAIWLTAISPDAAVSI